MSPARQAHFAKLTAALDAQREPAAPAPRPMTPVELCVANLLSCMTPDRETFGQAVAVVLGTLAAGDTRPYEVLRAAMHTAAGIVTGEGIRRDDEAA